jgi:hypothetical protein
LTAQAGRHFEMRPQIYLFNCGPHYRRPWQSYITHSNLARFVYAQITFDLGMEMSEPPNNIRLIILNLLSVRSQRPVIMQSERLSEEFPTRSCQCTSTLTSAGTFSPSYSSIYQIREQRVNRQIALSLPRHFYSIDMAPASL